MTLGEIPKHQRSQTKNLFLVLSVKEKDLKNNRKEVYQPLIRDLLKLQEGVLFDGKLIRAGLLVHLGDNLEVRFQSYFNSLLLQLFPLFDHIKELPRSVTAFKISLMIQELERYRVK
jgi:hypothetical protein